MDRWVCTGIDCRCPQCWNPHVPDEVNKIIQWRNAAEVITDICHHFDSRFIAPLRELAKILRAWELREYEKHPQLKDMVGREENQRDQVIRTALARYQGRAK